MICRICEQDKAIIQFYIRKETGLRRTECKTCLLARNRTTNTPEKNAIRCSDYRQDHKLEIKAMQKQYLKGNGIKFLAERRLYVNQLKDNPCMDCGLKFPPVCMDFDHVRGEKLFNISKLAKRFYKMETLKEEIAKCDLVCACCHRIRTANRTKLSKVQQYIQGIA